MLQGVESTTAGMLLEALDRASLRHAVIASNIANHAVEGHVPQRVAFGPLEPGAAGTSGAFRQPRVEAALDEHGNVESSSLDAMVADLGQNAVQYQVLARILDRQLGLLSLAATEGKR